MTFMSYTYTYIRASMKAPATHHCIDHAIRDLIADATHCSPLLLDRLQERLRLRSNAISNLTCIAQQC